MAALGGSLMSKKENEKIKGKDRGLWETQIVAG